MLKQKRRNFTGKEKVAAIRKHLIEQVKVSEICEQMQISPNQFYQWQKQFFENGENAFVKENKKKKRTLENKIDELKTKLSHKDNVISEIMSAFIEIKKKTGAL